MQPQLNKNKTIFPPEERLRQLSSCTSLLCRLHDLENYIQAQCVIISQHLLMHLSVSHWQCHRHIHENRNTFKYACRSPHTHPPGCTHTTHTCNVCTPETHPQSMLGFARDKQPWCEVWSVYLSRQCTVSVWGCGEWGIEMARRHRTAVQADFAKSCLSLNYRLHLPASPSSQHLSAALLSPSSRQSLVKRSCTAESSLNGRHTHTGLTHQGKDFINSL